MALAKFFFCFVFNVSGSTLSKAVSILPTARLYSCRGSDSVSETRVSSFVGSPLFKLFSAAATLLSNSLGSTFTPFTVTVSSNGPPVRSTIVRSADSRLSTGIPLASAISAAAFWRAKISTSSEVASFFNSAAAASLSSFGSAASSVRSFKLAARSTPSLYDKSTLSLVSNCFCEACSSFNIWPRLTPSITIVPPDALIVASVVLISPISLIAASTSLTLSIPASAGAIAELIRSVSANCCASSTAAALSGPE